MYKSCNMKEYIYFTFCVYMQMEVRGHPKSAIEDEWIQEPNDAC